MKELTDKELKILLEAEERIRLKKQWGDLVNDIDWEDDIDNLEETKEEKDAPIIQMKPKTKRRLSFKKYAAAAAIALFFCMGLFWVFQNSSGLDSPQALAMEYSAAVKKPYIAAPTKGENEDNQLIANIYQTYQKSDFNQVIALIRQAPASLGQQQSLQTILGYSYYQLGEYQNAVNTLKKVADTPDEDVPKDDAYWYLALSLLQLGQVEAAQAYLDKLIQEYDLKDEVAKRLLEEIKNLD